MLAYVIHCVRTRVAKGTVHGVAYTLLHDGDEECNVLFKRFSASLRTLLLGNARMPHRPGVGCSHERPNAPFGNPTSIYWR